MANVFFSVYMAIRQMAQYTNQIRWFLSLTHSLLTLCSWSRIFFIIIIIFVFVDKNIKSSVKKIKFLVVVVVIVTDLTFDLFLLSLIFFFSSLVWANFLYRCVWIINQTNFFHFLLFISMDSVIFFLFCSAVKKNTVPTFFLLERNFLKKTCFRW